MRRRSVVPVLCLLVAALAVLWPTAPAAAGGPTSVLVSVPGEGRVAALYYTQPAYDDLARAVGITGARPEAAPRNHGSGTSVTITWLVHDVAPWRIDQVYLQGDGTTWISTQEGFGAGELTAAEPVWHRGGTRLSALLDRLLPEGRGQTGATGAQPPAPLPLPFAEATAADTAAPPPDGTSGLRLAGAVLAGLLVGAAATATAFVMRRPRGTQSPTDDSASVGEQLVWP